MKTRMNTFKNIAFIILFGLHLSAYAEIYKYVDENGRVTYSNIAKKGAKKLDLEPISTISGTKPKSASSPTPSSFPKVDGETQRKRDDVRRRLLEEELANEQKQLAAAQQALKEGEGVRLGNEKNYQKYLDRVQGLKDEVTAHEKNLEALQKELAGTK